MCTFTSDNKPLKQAGGSASGVAQNFRPVFYIPIFRKCNSQLLKGKAEALPPRGVGQGSVFVWK